MTTSPRFAYRVAIGLAVVSVGLLAAGGLAQLMGKHHLAAAAWAVATVIGLLYAAATLAAALMRRQFSVDVIAFLALAGTLAVDEPLAGAVITLMLATGVLLEERANARARRELDRLTARAPTRVRRRRGDVVEQVPIAEIAEGDRVVVGPGEVVPVDGHLLAAGAFDESALTGEPLPVERAAGDEVRSGVVNAGSAVDLVATATAADSSYAAVVRLVEQAQASSAPFVRLADRVAVVFVPAALLVAGAAWAASGSAARAVAVLVVATPCPLLLAAPIAIISGISRAAKRGVVVKGGASLERLGDGRAVLLDKTGTLTAGHPEVVETAAAPGVELDRVLGMAAAVEQLSPHVLAGGVVRAARTRGLPVPVAVDVREEHGYGVAGTVDGHQVRVGKAVWILDEGEPAWAARVRRRADVDGSLCVFVAVDGVPAGALLLEDPIRPDAPRLIRVLRRAGIERVVLLTGDRQDVADGVGRVVGVDEVRAECDPAAKLATVQAESAKRRTVMVGDGVNDAPALAAADAGVALATGGATASSEAADVVVTVERLDALADAMVIARRSRRIGWTAAVVGMGLSFIAMAAAAFGWLAAAPGALLQEAIDVAAMGIALTALLPTHAQRQAVRPEDVAVLAERHLEHDRTLAVVDEIRDVADGLSTQAPDLQPVRTLLRRMEEELVPHEQEDQRVLVPLVAGYAGGPEATAALSRAHAEIDRYVVQLRRLLAATGDGSVPGQDVIEIRRLLYGLYGVLRLHNALEDEATSGLVPSPG